MHFIKMGIDYRTTPLEIREKFTFTEDQIEGAILAINKKKHVLENVVVSTCNRTELFTVVKDVEKGKQDILEFLREWFGERSSDMLPYLTFSKEEEVIRHAFQLAAGLDSMVLGETQILGQVKDAYLTAIENKTTNKYFNELFHRVITFGKQAHRNTAIGQHAVSTSYVAVELLKKIFGDIKDKHAVILGAGEMGESSLKNLRGAGVSTITIINRSLHKATGLAEKFKAETAPLGELDQVLTKADLLICSTAATEVILTKQRLARINKQRKEKPLILIDLAVPRDIDEEAGTLDNIYLYTIDDLKTVTDKNMLKRKEAANELQIEIEKELASYKEWLALLDVVPIIKALNVKSSQIQERTLESISRKIPDLDEREMKVIRKHTKSIVNQLLEQPNNRVKQVGAPHNSDELKAVYKALFIDVFGLEDQMNKEKYF